MTKRVRDFLYNLDRAGASLFGAPPQETISSEIGRSALRGEWWGRGGHWVLNHTLGANHCENAIIHADALDKVDA